jgi:hypothetical protein
MRVWMLICLLTWSRPSGSIEPDRLRAAWEQDTQAIAGLSQLAWLLQEGDLEALATGKPVVRPLQLSADLVTVGMIWMDSPREDVWLAIHDRDDRPLMKGSLVYQTLPPASGSWRTSHALMHLPWPLRDRQWVSIVRVNQALLQTTEGRALERWVELGEPSLAENPDPDAMWLGELHGGWLLFELDVGTLAFFSASSPSVGPIPKDILQPWVSRSVTQALKRLQENASTVSEHYRGSHELIPAPDGQPQPLYP